MSSTFRFGAGGLSERGEGGHSESPHTRPLASLHSSRGVALCDADDDGDLDMLIVDVGEPPRGLRNDTIRQGRWIGVHTVGTWSNRDGYGSKVTVHAQGKRWTREVRAANGLFSSQDPRLIIGLGQVRGVDRVEVRWPDGGLQVVEFPALDAMLTVKEDASNR